jgi:hypothetical protein
MGATPDDSLEARQRLVQKWQAEALANPPSPEDWADLVVAFRLASEVDKCDTPPGTPPGIPAADLELQGVVRFIMNQRNMKLNANPLLRTLSALGDLSAGQVHPMLRPINRKRKNPGKGHVAAMLQGCAARAYSELVEGGVPRQQAARKVADALRPASKRGLGTVDAKTVINWQARLSQGPGPGAPDLAVQHYRAPVDGLSDTPLARGKALLAALRDRAAGLMG